MLNITKKRSRRVTFFTKQFAFYSDLKTMLGFLCQGKVAVIALPRYRKHPLFGHILGVLAVHSLYKGNNSN